MERGTHAHQAHEVGGVCVEPQLAIRNLMLWTINVDWRRVAISPYPGNGSLPVCKCIMLPNSSWVFDSCQVPLDRTL